MRRHLPNSLTVLRFFLVPLFAALVLWGKSWGLALAALVAVFAFITDMLDGWLARRWKTFSNFGICFDPVADKAFVISAFVCLINNPKLGLSIIPFILIILREFVVMGLRVVLLISRKDLLPAEHFGKVKSAVQVWFIFVAVSFLWLESLNSVLVPLWTINWLFWLVGIFTVLSAISYLRGNSRALSEAWSSQNQSRQ